MLFTFIGLELLASVLLPLLPVVVAASALLSPLRTSPWRMFVVWALAGLLSVLLLAPFVVSRLDLPTIQEGPTHEVTG